jgi:dTDP-4-amino-4,6-dideoxygalactose transaminase
MEIPFISPNINQNDINNCIDSIKSGWLAYGAYNDHAERLLAKYLNVDDFIMTSSCTASLQMSLMLCDIGKGDEVITTPLSWVATSNVILNVGASVVFADVDYRNGMLDLQNIVEKVTSKTKAIIVVDLYGQMFDIQSLKKSIPDTITIIEDAAHSFGAKKNNFTPGQLADFTCFSFHAAKNLTSGQGGGLVCNNEQHRSRARILRRDGVIGKNQMRTMVDLGHKFDSTDFQSALLINQIERYSLTHSRRFSVYENYEIAFKDIEQIRFQERNILDTHSGHMFVVWLDSKVVREDFIEYLNSNNIQVSVHYNPIHLEPYYSKMFGYKAGDFPIAEKIGHSCVSLPTYPALSNIDQDKIVETIKMYFK